MLVAATSVAGETQLSAAAAAVGPRQGVLTVRRSTALACTSDWSPLHVSAVLSSVTSTARAEGGTLHCSALHYLTTVLRYLHISPLSNVLALPIVPSGPH